MRDINRCHPRLIELSKKLVSACRGQGLIIGIGESFRTKEEQDALYAKGRTAPRNIVTNAKGSSYSSHTAMTERVFIQTGTVFLKR